MGEYKIDVTKQIIETIFIDLNFSYINLLSEKKSGTLAITITQAIQEE